MRVTVDNNCLISLKTGDGEYSEIKALLDMHPNQIILRVPAIAASENQQGGRLHTNFAQFQQFLAEIGCEGCELLNPMAYVDLWYLGHAVLPDDHMISVEREIHDVLFPDIPFGYSEYCERFGLDSDSGAVDQKWRRAKCDVQAMWCHIYYNGDIFVTQDNNFHKATKKDRLVALGALEILRPTNCLSILRGTTKI